MKYSIFILLSSVMGTFAVGQPTQTDDRLTLYRAWIRRIEGAEAKDLKTISAELKNLQDSELRPENRIWIQNSLGDKCTELSMPQQAAEHYQQAVVKPHSRDREGASECAGAWEGAMERLLQHYFDSDQRQEILKTLNGAGESHSGISFETSYYRLQIYWRGKLDEPGTAEYAKDTVAHLLKQIPDNPTSGLLNSLIKLFFDSQNVPSETRISWLEQCNKIAIQSIRNLSEPYERFQYGDPEYHFRNLLFIRRELAEITARREGDLTQLDNFGSELDKLFTIVLAEFGSDSEEDTIWRDRLHTLLIDHQSILTTTRDEMKAEILKPEILGKKAFALSGVWATEKQYRIGDLSDRVVLLDFWAIWCGPCIAQLPRLKELYAQFDRDQLEIIGVTRAYGYSWDEEKSRPIPPERESPQPLTTPDQGELAAIRSFTLSQGVEWPQFVDDGTLSSNCGISLIPTIVLIGTDGRIADVIVGRSQETKERLFERVGELLQETF